MDRLARDANLQLLFGGARKRGTTMVNGSSAGQITWQRMTTIEHRVGFHSTSAIVQNRSFQNLTDCPDVTEKLLKDSEISTRFVVDHEKVGLIITWLITMMWLIISSVVDHHMVAHFVTWMIITWMIITWLLISSGG